MLLSSIEGLLNPALCTQPLMRADALTFIFRLSFLSLERDYPIAGLKDTQKQVMEDLARIGLVMLKEVS